MKRNHFFIIFLVIMTAGLSFYFVAQQGWYPIAVVNLRLISARTVLKHSVAAARYYSSVFQPSNLPAEASEEIKRAALDKLIENALIYDELKNKVKDWDELVSARIKALNLDKNKVQEALAVLYGLNFDEFTDLVLRPEARKEILLNYVTQKGKEDFSEWLADAKARASVTILTAKFRWDGGKVVRD